MVFQKSPKKNVLTSSAFGCDRFTGVGWFTGSSNVNSFHTELVLDTLVEVIDSSLAFRSGFARLYPSWAVFLAFLNYVSSDWRSTIV